jgi:hypothetical protein
LTWLLYLCVSNFIAINHQYNRLRLLPRNNVSEAHQTAFFMKFGELLCNRGVRSPSRSTHHSTSLRFDVVLHKDQRRWNVVKPDRRVLRWPDSAAGKLTNKNPSVEVQKQLTLIATKRNRNNSYPWQLLLI